MLIEDNEKLKTHITEYYKMLFGKEPVSPVHLSQDIWASDGRVSDVDCADLTKPFTMDEIEEAVK